MHDAEVGCVLLLHALASPSVLPNFARVHSKLLRPSVPHANPAAAGEAIRASGSADTVTNSRR
jgi:hypothetical protein